MRRACLVETIDSDVAEDECEDEYVYEPSDLRKALDADEDLELGYIANIACVLMDNIPGLKRGENAYLLRNKVAKLILDKIIR